MDLFEPPLPILTNIHSRHFMTMVNIVQERREATKRSRLLLSHGGRQTASMNINN